jgi:ligand-binding sensor domain-containing protein/two-component sensor histidine kinase
MFGVDAKRILRTGWGFAVVLICSLNVSAERLPIKTYTTADGLAHNVVNRIVRDSRGFLWFCTREGLSRFDGYSFTNYGLEHGLPSATINDLLETSEGVYWVATAGGLCRFNPLPRAQAANNGAADSNRASDLMFKVYSPGQDAGSKYVLSLLQDRAGVVWCGTRNGLYRVEAASDKVNLASVDLGIAAHFESRFIECLLEDRSGSLWIGTPSGLYRRWPDGRVEAYTRRDGLPDNIIQSLLEDREGRIWVGTRFGALFRLVPDPKSGRNIVARVYSDKDGLPARWINQLFQASDGRMWAGSNMGLIQFMPTDQGEFRFRLYSEAHGLSYHEVGSLAEDRNGNLWLGTLNAGAAKIARNGFTIFGKEDGFYSASSIFDTRAGDLFVFGTRNGKEGLINRFDGEKFLAIRLQIADGLKKHRYGWGWGWNQTVVEDQTGEWWVATERGVCRFPKVKPEQLAHTPPKAVYTTRDGLAADMILRLFEDSRGDIWIGSVGNGVGLNGLSRWERRSGTFHHYTEKEGLPRLDTFYVSSFAEDRAGNLWIGLSGDGGMVHYHNGGFHLLTSTDGVPAGQIRNMLVDSAGRLWITSYRGGLGRIDDPSAERPILVTYTVADGLSSNETTAVTEDQWGRIYVCTGRGIDRLDPATGYIKHYTTADGLPLGEAEAALRDRRGALWFSFTGVARLIPQPDPPSLPPPILITSLQIAGQTQPISALGEVKIAPLELGADKNQLQIDFVALGFSSGEGLRYQYKLEGASNEWSHLTDARTVNFSNLAPGAYRFLVRATNADGVLSETPASLSFTILPPVWQRWWFMSISAALLGLVAYALYRYRVTRLLQLEQVRTRIAADLHDDIGANLTTIAVLSEVVHQQLDGANAMAEAPISSIARLSRESVSSMSDIVWAINPKKDSLRDLTRRMRAFATEIFTSHNIDFEFQPPAADLDLKLGADVRRTVYLIFKEAVNNIARHSACEKATIDIHVEGTRLVLRIADDGKGFDAATVTDGNGLQSMRKRAKDSGGETSISTNPPHGTTITLRLPAHR